MTELIKEIGTRFTHCYLQCKSDVTKTVALVATCSLFDGCHVPVLLLVYVQQSSDLHMY